MPLTREQIFAEAMSLDPRERERLAEDLWHSVDETTREQVDAEWLAEIRRRTAAADRGEMASFPADEVFARLESRLRP